MYDSAVLYTSVWYWTLVSVWWSFMCTEVFLFWIALSRKHFNMCQMYCHLKQCFPTLFLEAHQQCTFWMFPLSDQYISGPGVSTNELIQVCLIRKSWKMCCVCVSPGTGLGNTDLKDLNVLFNLLNPKMYEKLCVLVICRKSIVCTLAHTHTEETEHQIAKVKF